jgi:hypothetical protein
MDATEVIPPPLPFLLAKNVPFSGDDITNKRVRV